MNIKCSNIRTFSGDFDIPVTQLTVLTGENSAGKTTFLSVVAALFDEQFPFNPPFDTAPYSLGSYDTIATYKGGRYGRAKQIGIGYDTEGSGERRYNTYAKYESDEGRVALVDWETRLGNQHLHLLMTSDKAKARNARVKITADEGKRASFDLEVPRSLGDQNTPLSLQNIILSGLFQKAEGMKGGREFFDSVIRLTSFNRGHRVVSVAPIRTRPQRLYSQAKQAFEPTGDHIPFVLDRLFTGNGDKSERRQIISALEQFGHESSLFESVSIKKLGTKGTDPFQVMIGLAGRSRNVIDVGYGVSQALPVVAEVILEHPNTTILMQQPEVHLHPKAQAALGSFFCRMVKVGGRRLIVETHSDFIVDRIRQEVASGVIPPGWVSILFFHRKAYDSSVYPLRLDGAGNVLDSPDFYRDFFLREELRLLERGS